MTRDEVQHKVIELAAAQAGVSPAEVLPAHHFINDLNYDSLDVVEFGMSVEDVFNISIPDEELQKIQFVNDVTDYIFAHQETSAAST